MKNEWVEQAQRTLWSRDFSGYSHEMANIEVLKKHGLYKYVVYRNPKNPRLWKRKKGVGVDMVVKVGDHAVYVEESFCSKPYYYRLSWFIESRLKRFEHYPNDSFHHWVIWTNKPQNFQNEAIQKICNQKNIKIVNTNGILKLIYKLIQQIKKPPQFLVVKLLRYFGLSVTDSNVASVISDIDTNSELTDKTNKVYAYRNETKQQDQKQPIKDQIEHINQIKHSDKG